MVSSARLLVGGTPIGDPLPVLGGQVTLDRTQDTMGTCRNLVLAGGDSLPDAAPYGAEVAIAVGVRYDDDTTELLPVGVYPIQVTSTDLRTWALRAQLTDRSQRVRDARFEDEYAIAAGTNFGAAIQAIIDSRVPGLTYSLTPTSYTTPALVFPAWSDPWAAARKMARDIGMELYFDGAGVVVMRPTPAVKTTADWTIAEGERGALIGGDVTLDRGPAYNKVVATGENASTAAAGTAPPTGSATDTDPTSRGRYDGPFGRKPRGYSSPFITTNAQAAAAAASILADSVGVARSINLTALPNPAIEPGDTVLVHRAPLVDNELHLVDVVNIDLSPSTAMTLSTRARRAA